MKRRSVLVALAGALGAGLAAIGTWKLRKPTLRRPRKKCLPVPEGASNAPELILNPRTGTVHAASPCRLHLPRRGRPLAAASAPDAAAACLHTSHAAAILEELAQKATRSNDVKAALDYLLAATTISPRSYRLYDRLIRLYGKEKRYDEIDALLARGHTVIQALNIPAPDKQSSLKSLNARVEHVRRRAERARLRAQGSRQQTERARSR